MLNEEQIKSMLRNFDEEDKENLIKYLLNSKKKEEQEIDISKLSNNYQCPYCQSNKICKNGFIHNKTQQFKCSNCKKNYSIYTNTIFYHSNKSIEVWREYIELFSQGLALRKIVEKMDKKISYPTAFYWRHKILEVMKNFDNHDKLDGIVEADETFFEESQKGSRKMTRKQRKRGYSCYSYTQKKKSVCINGY